MGWTTIEHNETKGKMKQPFDIAKPGFEPRCYRPVANSTVALCPTGDEEDKWK